MTKPTSADAILKDAPPLIREMLASSGERSRLHHFIPQSHLANFAAKRSRPQIWAYDKVTDRYFGPTNPVNLAALRDYNTIDIGTGPTDVMEKLLSAFDGQAAPVVRKLCEQGGATFKLSVPERYYLSMYLACLHLRGPAFRGGYQQKVEDLATDAVAAYARRAGKEFRNVKRRRKARRAAEALGSGALRLSLAGEIGIVGLKSIRTLAPEFASMTWTLLANSGSQGFVLGDNPAAVLAREAAPDLRDASVEIALPLSPSRLLLLSRLGPEGQILPVDSDAGPRRLASVTTGLPPSYGVGAWRTAYRHVFAASESDLRAVGDQLSEEERREAGIGTTVPYGHLTDDSSWVVDGSFPNPEHHLRTQIPKTAFKSVGAGRRHGRGTAQPVRDPRPE